MYRIKMSHKDFLNNSNLIQCENVLLEEDGVSFETDKKTAKLMKNKVDCNVKQKYKFRTSFIIGFVLFIFSVFLYTNSIFSIEFNGDYPINDEILYLLEDNMKHIGPLSYLDCNLGQVNETVRQKYIGYEWISIEKKGTTLYVNINQTDILDRKSEEIKGNIIAKSDGIVMEYSVFQGSTTLENNMYVKKGDILILGNDKEARGLILAGVITEETIKVKKQIVEDNYTGKLDYCEKISFFSMDKFFHKNNEFNRFDTVEKTYFDFKILSYKKNIYYEKCDIITIYNEDEALEYARSIIQSEFLKEKKYDCEKVVNAYLLNQQTTEDYYEFTFLIKKYQNIGEFLKE